MYYYHALWLAMWAFTFNYSHTYLERSFMGARKGNLTTFDRFPLTFNPYVNPLCI